MKIEKMKTMRILTKAFAVMLICVLMLTTAVTVDAKAKKAKAAKKKTYTVTCVQIPDYNSPNMPDYLYSIDPNSKARDKIYKVFGGKPWGTFNDGSYFSDLSIDIKNKAYIDYANTHHGKLPAKMVFTKTRKNCKYTLNVKLKYDDEDWNTQKQRAEERKADRVYLDKILDELRPILATEESVNDWYYKLCYTNKTHGCKYTHFRNCRQSLTWRKIKLVGLWFQMHSSYSEDWNISWKALYEGNFRGVCLDGAGYVRTILRELGFNAILIRQGQINHAWCVCDNGSYWQDVENTSSGYNIPYSILSKNFEEWPGVNNLMLELYNYMYDNPDTWASGDISGGILDVKREFEYDRIPI
ncbi:MAG: hypothetical protein VZQ83_04420 [Eubacterium sp.]|nr:hypothetical protein [Eubacterium sp.]